MEKKILIGGSLLILIIVVTTILIIKNNQANIQASAAAAAVKPVTIPPAPAQIPTGNALNLDNIRGTNYGNTGSNGSNLPANTNGNANGVAIVQPTWLSQDTLVKDQGLIAAIEQVDKQIYGNIGWKSFSQEQLHADQSLPQGKRKFGNLQNQWEITKWQIALSDGYIPKLPVPAEFNDYSQIDNSGRYYLHNFGTNYYYSVSMDDKVNTLKNFIYNWQKYAQYQPPRDGQVALFALKMAAAMVAGAGTAGIGSLIAVAAGASSY